MALFKSTILLVTTRQTHETPKRPLYWIVDKVGSLSCCDHGTGPFIVDVICLATSQAFERRTAAAEL
jgi:hypothetical protein